MLDVFVYLFDTIIDKGLLGSIVNIDDLDFIYELS